MYRSNQERGYSLTEALVVLAIVGIVSMIAVPNFMAMYRSAKVKAAVSQFTNDVRGARQQAVTKYRPMMVSVGTDGDERYSYWIYSWDGAAWNEEAVRSFEPDVSVDRKSVYFGTVGYPDSVTVAGSGRRDVIFETTGGVRNPPNDQRIRIRTDEEVGKPEFIITVFGSGSVKVE